MPIAHIGDLELDYERAGSGPPLLMIMGMSGTYLHWDQTFLSELRKSFDVLVYDHRGVGQSSHLSAPFTISDLAHDALGLLASLKIERAHVLGFSMGGMVAQELVLAQPESVAALVLAGTYCGGQGSAQAPAATMEKLAGAMLSGDRALALRVAWEANVSPAFADNAAAYARFQEIAERRRVAQEVVMEQLRAIVAHDTSARLGSITAPTLVLHGTQDGMLPVQNASMIASLVPQARCELLEGDGHLFFWEEPQRAGALIYEHLGSAHGQALVAGAPSI